MFTMSTNDRGFHVTNSVTGATLTYPSREAFMEAVSEIDASMWRSIDQMSAMEDRLLHDRPATNPPPPEEFAVRDTLKTGAPLVAA